MADATRVELVRGKLSDERAAQVLELWSTHGALTGDAALERLTQLVAVVLDGERVVGVSSVYESNMPVIGNRPFWMYRRFAPGVDEETDQALVNATFDALDGERCEQGPVGLCVIVDDPELLQRRPEAIWPETQLVHAGYLPDDRALRIRFLTDAIITTPLPGRRMELPNEDEWLEVFPLSSEYAIEPYDESDKASTDGVSSLWTDIGMRAEVRTRRLSEVLLVARHGGTIVGVLTTYLRHNAQLRVDAWHVRALVAEDHRRSSIAAHLGMRGVEELERRHATGEDTRGVGVITEVENAHMRAAFPQAVWPAMRAHYIGDSSIGATVYIRYFPGVLVT